MKLRALGYGALDQIAARILDLGVLIVALRTFPSADLALFGLATGALFVFNLVLVTPETALVRHRREWHGQGTLHDHLWSYVQFSVVRIGLVAIGAALAWVWLGGRHPVFLATAWALTQQVIQSSEIVRLERRVALQQREVFKVEVVAKMALFLAMTALLVQSSIEIYIAIYLTWAVTLSAFWLIRLRLTIAPTQLKKRDLWGLAWRDLAGFSLYAHLFGIITYGLYNVDPWVLSAFGNDIDAIASYTAALKSSALFFMAPMFLQFMTSAFLQNASSQRDRSTTLARMWCLTAALATAQLVFFMLAGGWLGVMLVGRELDVPTYYQLGLWICSGVFVLNLVRPLIADLLLQADVRRVLWVVFVPTSLAAAALYPSMTWLAGPVGCAMASAAAYFIFGALVVLEWLRPRGLRLGPSSEVAR